MSVAGEWIEPELLNGWETAPGFSPPAVRRNKEGAVEARGAAQGGRPPSVVFILPKGYRPTAGVRFYQSVERGGHAWSQVIRVEVSGEFIVESEQDMGPIPYSKDRDSLYEKVTYGQGSFGYRNLVTGEDDYYG